MQEIVVDRKDIYLLTGGNPAQQLNKIRQTDWNGLENYLRVYFSDEIAPKPSDESLQFIMDKHQLKPEEILLFGTSSIDKEFAGNAGVDYLQL